MYHLDYFMVVHSVGKGEEILDVEGIIVQVFHWILNYDVALSQASVHGGGRAEDINYRIHMMIRGFMSDVDTS